MKYKYTCKEKSKSLTTETRLSSEEIQEGNWEEEVVLNGEDLNSILSRLDALENGGTP